jgi:hypothetical protein
MQRGAVVVVIGLQDAVAGFSRMAIRSRILNTSSYSVNQIVTTVKGHNPSVIVVYNNYLLV